MNPSQATGQTVARGARHPLAMRGIVLLALLAIEIISLHSPYDLTGRDRLVQINATAFVTTVLNIAGYVLCGIAAFAVVCWPERVAVFAGWRQAAGAHRWRPWATASGLIAALMLGATLAAKFAGLGADVPLGLVLGAWSVAILTMLALLLTAAAPPAYWARFAGEHKTKLMIALGAVGMVWLLASVSQNSWDRLSQATFELALWFLSRFESDIQIDFAQRVLGVGDFAVQILPACSGYEGIGLVIGFLALYVAVFRTQLKFPNILVLFPLGALAIWLLNAMRIALIVSVGAHISPNIAMHGFHSQAGWLMFLLVTLSIMGVAHRASFFRANAGGTAAAQDPNVRLALALILPFVALMAGRIPSAMFASVGYWTYSVEIALACAVLWFYRDVYRDLVERVSLEAILAGLAVGIAWVWTEPTLGHFGPVDAWVGALPAGAAAGWLTMRIFGLTVLVPIAEELVFRGYLHRALVSRRFEAATIGQFGWLAFVVSTGVFGAMHSRWLSACLAGAVYAILMYRSRRLSDPIAAHAASNAVIAAAAIATHQWSLL